MGVSERVLWEKHISRNMEKGGREGGEKLTQVRIDWGGSSQRRARGSCRQAQRLR